MREKIKYNFKRIVSVLCAIVLVATSLYLYGKPMENVQAATQTYLDATFSDFGMNDGTIGNYGSSQGTVPSGMTTWNGARFNGKVTIPENAEFGDNDGLFALLFGGVEGTENWNNLYGADNGINIFITKASIYAKCNYTGATTGDTALFTQGELSTAGITHIGQEFQISVAFDYVDDGAVEVLVTVFQGENVISKILSFAGAADKMSANFCIATAQNKENIAYASYVPEVTYTDVTFSTFGVDDSTIGSYGSKQGTVPSGMTTWNGVRFSGNVTIPENTEFGDNDGLFALLFGGVEGTENWNNLYGADNGINIFITKASIYAKCNYTGATTGDTTLFTKDELTTAGITHIGQEIQISAAFKNTVSGAVDVLVTVSQGENVISKTLSFAGAADKMSANFCIATAQNKEEVAYASYVPEVTYTDVTFSTFGMDDSTIGSYGSKQGTVPSGMTDWNLTRFTGMVTVPENEEFGDNDGLFALLFGGVEGTENWNNLYGDDNGVNIFITKASIFAKCKYTDAKTGDTTLFTKDDLTAAGITHIGQEIQISAAFKNTVSGAVDVLVTVSQGENVISKTLSFAGAADKMSANFCIATAQNKEEVAYASYVPEVTYTDVTFSTLGITDSTIQGYGTCANGVLPTTSTSWNKVRFIGELTIPSNSNFSETTDVAQLYFGGDSGVGVYGDNYRVSIFITPGSIQLRTKQSGASEIPSQTLFTSDALTSAGITHIGKAVQYSVSFQYIGDNVNVTVTAEQDGNSVEASYVIEGIASNLTTNFTLGTWQNDENISYTSVSSTVEPDEPVPTERTLTFSDFGIEDKSYSGGNYTGLCGTAPSDVTTLNKVTFVGKIKVGTHEGEHLLFGGVDDATDVYKSNYGIVLSPAGDYGLTIDCEIADSDYETASIITKDALDEAGISLVGDELIWKVRFDYVDNDVTVTVTLQNGDKSVTGTYTYQGIAKQLSTNLVYNPWGSTSSIASYIEYRELTFKDFGIESQSFNGGTTGIKGTAPSDVTSLDRVRFIGRIKVDTHSDEHLLFGGANDADHWDDANCGIGFFNVGDYGLHMRCKIADTTHAEKIIISKDALDEAGINLCGDEITWNVEFLYISNDVQVTVTLLKGTSSVTGTYTYEGIADSLSTNMVFNPGNSIGQINAEFPVPDSDTVITFYDFNYIEDMSMTQGASNAGELVKGQATCISSFDNVTFKGTVSYVTNETLSIPVLLFGGEEDSEYWTNIYGTDKGFYLSLYNGGKIKIGVSRGSCQSEVEIGDAFASNTSIDIKINFAYDDADLVVTVYLTQGDTVLERTARFEGAATAIGTSTWLVVAPYGAEMTIKSAYTRDVTKDDEEYVLDLDNPKAYLLTGENITVNGESKTAGDSLSETGDYTIVFMKNGVKYTQKVSIYALGDLELDATIGTDGNLVNTINSVDLVIMLKCIQGEKTCEGALEKAADLTNDNLVDDDDAEALRQVLVDKIAIDEYYPAALTYAFLGDAGKDNGDEVMPIAGYYGPYKNSNYDFLTTSVFGSLQEAKINLLVSSPMDYSEGTETKQNILKALALGEKYQVGMYISDSRMNQIVATGETKTNTLAGGAYGTTYAEMKRESYIQTAAEAANYLTNYSYFDSLLGTMVRDEPSTATFPTANYTMLDSGNRLEWYSDVAKILNSFTNSFGYINAQCYSGTNKATPEFVLGIESANTINYNYEENTSVELYKTYLNAILKDSSSQVLSYDNYMYGTGVDGNKRSAQNANTWIVNLDTVRSVAKNNDTEHEVPFWAFVASGACDQGQAEVTNTDDIMTQAQFQWQVNVPLAFGAKGIQYFTVIQPEDWASDADTANATLTRTGLFNLNGEKTTWYNYAKEINEQIASIDHVLMKADNKGVMISEGTSSYAYKNMVNISYQRYGTSSLREYSVQNYTLDAYKSSDPQGHVTSFTSSNTEYGAIAGVFSYQGKTAYYVVNWSDATTGTDTITLTFNKNSKYTVIQNAKTTAGNGTTCELSLAAGEGVLVVLND